MSQEDFYLAAQNNDLAALNKALNDGANINATTQDGWSALHFAAFRGNVEIVAALIKAKASLDIKGAVYGRTALHYAVDRANVAVVKMLIAAGAKQDLKDSSGATALDLARKKGFEEIVKLFGV